MLLSHLLGPMTTPVSRRRSAKNAATDAMNDPNAQTLGDVSGIDLVLGGHLPSWSKQPAGRSGALTTRVTSRAGPSSSTPGRSPVHRIPRLGRTSRIRSRRSADAASFIKSYTWSRAAIRPPVARRRPHRSVRPEHPLRSAASSNPSVTRPIRGPQPPPRRAVCILPMATWTA